MLGHRARAPSKLSTARAPHDLVGGPDGHTEKVPTPAFPAPRLLTLAQAAELLTIDVDEVLALLREGSLRGVCLGSSAQWRVEHDSIADYIEEQIEQTRRMHLWNQSNAASFPELWGTGVIRHGD